MSVANVKRRAKRGHNRLLAKHNRYIHSTNHYKTRIIIFIGSCKEILYSSVLTITKYELLLNNNSHRLQHNNNTQMIRK